MKTKKYILILLLILPFFLVACKKNTPFTKNKSDKDVPTNAKELKESFNMSPLELAKLGKTFRCTFEETDEDGLVKITGTTYVNKDKVRTDSTIEFNIDEESGFEEEPMEMSSLIVDGMMYVWGESNIEGSNIKMSIKEMEESVENNPNVDRQLNTKFDYDCNMWIPDNSKFDVPSDVTFTDYSEMMESVNQMQQDNDEMMKSLCDTCDMLPDEEAKAECRANLSCE